MVFTSGCAVSKQWLRSISGLRNRHLQDSKSPQTCKRPSACLSPHQYKPENQVPWTKSHRDMWRFHRDLPSWYFGRDCSLQGDHTKHFGTKRREAKDFKITATLNDPTWKLFRLYTNIDNTNIDFSWWGWKLGHSPESKCRKWPTKDPYTCSGGSTNRRAPSSGEHAVKAAKPMYGATT